jgi:hypothetical protein
VSAPSSPDQYQDYDTDNETDDPLHSVQLSSSLYIETQLCRHTLAGGTPCDDKQQCVICHLSQVWCVRPSFRVHLILLILCVANNSVMFELLITFIINCNIDYMPFGGHMQPRWHNKQQQRQQRHQTSLSLPRRLSPPQQR